MTMKILVLIPLMLGLVSTVSGKSCVGSIVGATWHMDGIIHTKYVSSVEECQEVCTEYPDCRGFTWVQEGVLGHCFMFNELKDLRPCAGCHSETWPETMNSTCSSSADDIIDEFNVDSLIECADLCYEFEGCEGYTWYDRTTPFPGFCFLFSSCSESLPCIGCSSGKVNCFSAPQCYQYNILDEESRNLINHNPDSTGYADDEGHVYTSGKWKGTGYYRFQEPAGIRMPSKSPGDYHCGTYKPGYINDPDGKLDDIEVGVETEAAVCFDDYEGDCIWQYNITVTKCPGDYFVYLLDNTPGFHFRYCASL